MTHKKKIGIYGGTFNPPHVAHVKACEAFCRAVKPDELLIIPDYLPPHKQLDDGASALQRLEMSRLAFSSIPQGKVSDIEIERGGRSYTAVTLSELKTEENELYFLCGTDMFLTLDTWYRPDMIFSLATICYVRRENEENNSLLIRKKAEEYKKVFNANVMEIVMDVTVLSSSVIRDMIRKGDDVSELLPKDVIKYISDNGVYR